LEECAFGSGAPNLECLFASTIKRHAIHLLIYSVPAFMGDDSSESIAEALTIQAV
jgi:hypothetical protein